MSKSFSTRARPALPISLAKSGSRRRRKIAVASACGSRGGTSNPEISSATTSGVPPTCVATTGRPRAIASSSVSETPSVIDERTYMLVPLKSAATSPTSPRNRTCRSKPRADVRTRKSPRHAPAPAISRRKPASSRTTSAVARSSVAISFSGLRRATIAAGPAWFGPEKPKRSRSMPFH